jgi:hypothetical protein
MATKTHNRLPSDFRYSPGEVLPGGAQFHILPTLDQLITFWKQQRVLPYAVCSTSEDNDAENWFLEPHEWIFAPTPAAVIRAVLRWDRYEMRPVWHDWANQYPEEHAGELTIVRSSMGNVDSNQSLAAAHAGRPCHPTGKRSICQTEAQARSAWSQRSHADSTGCEFSKSPSVKPLASTDRFHQKPPRLLHRPHALFLISRTPTSPTVECRQLVIRFRAHPLRKPYRVQRSAFAFRHETYLQSLKLTAANPPRSSGVATDVKICTRPPTLIAHGEMPFQPIERPHAMTVRNPKYLPSV